MFSLLFHSSFSPLCGKEQKNKMELHVFGRPGCGHTQRLVGQLTQKGTPFIYHALGDEKIPAYATRETLWAPLSVVWPERAGHWTFPTVLLVDEPGRTVTFFSGDIIPTMPTNSVRREAFVLFTDANEARDSMAKGGQSFQFRPES